MAIQIETREVGGVTQLVANSEGWRIQQTEYNLNPRLFVTGNPDVISQTPDELRESLQLAWRTTKEQRPKDFDGLKVAVSRLSVRDGKLRTEAYATDYFTLWGIPKAAKEQFQKHEREVVINRDFSSSNASYETSLPWGICTHNVLLDKNGEMLLMVRSQGQGFHAGRVSATEEEQMDPDRDFDPFNAAYTSYFEELGILVPPSTVRLLGVGMEKGAAYPAYCFVANTDLIAPSIVDTWRKAPDYKENTSLFSVPIGRIDEWLQDKVTVETWQKYHLAGNITPDAILNLHPTVPWRIGLIKEYIK